MYKWEKLIGSQQNAIELTKKIIVCFIKLNDDGLWGVYDKDGQLMVSNGIYATFDEKEMAIEWAEEQFIE